MSIIEAEQQAAPVSVTVSVGGKDVTFETGKLAKQYTVQSGKKILVGATKEALVALIMTDTGSGASRLTRPSPRGGAAPLTSALRARAFWRDGGGADIELLEDFLISYRLIMPSRDLLNMLFKVYDTFETKSLVLPKYADSGESAPPRAARAATARPQRPQPTTTPWTPWTPWRSAGTLPKATICAFTWAIWRN